MNITATTTDADILATVEYARERLIKTATARARAESINTEALSVARAEGEARAHTIARNVLAEGGDKDRVIAALTASLLAGADDTWSGRGNDAARAKHDGFRDATQRLIWSL